MHTQTESFPQALEGKSLEERTGLQLWGGYFGTGTFCLAVMLLLTKCNQCPTAWP